MASRRPSPPLSGRAQAVKVSLPRPVRQGGLHDSDSYGGQQYAPLVDLAIAG